MPVPPNFSGAARQQARNILSKPPYRNGPSHTPRPFAGVLHDLGRALNAAIGHPAEWLYHHLLIHIGHGFHTAFGNWWLVVLFALAIGLGIAVGFLIVRRRTRVSTRKSALSVIDTPKQDPGQIEKEAAEAEAAGDYETAVRLWFRAGLLRLQVKGVVSNQRAQTTHQLSERLHSPTFDSLARRHEVIVYARHPATADDSATARTGWPRVLVEARSGPPSDDGGRHSATDQVGAGSS